MTKKINIYQEECKSKNNNKILKIIRKYCNIITQIWGMQSNFMLLIPPNDLNSLPKY